MLILKKPVIIYVRNLFHRHNKYHHSTTSRQPGNPGTVATQAGAIVSSHTGFSHCTRSHYCHLDFHIQLFFNLNNSYGDKYHSTPPRLVKSKPYPARVAKCQNLQTRFYSKKSAQIATVDLRAFSPPSAPQICIIALTSP